MMANGAYIGIDGLARKVTNMYIGVDGVARKVKTGYIGVDGIARQFWTSTVPSAYPKLIDRATIENNIRNRYFASYTVGNYYELEICLIDEDGNLTGFATAEEALAVNFTFLGEYGGEYSLTDLDEIWPGDCDSYVDYTMTEAKYESSIGGYYLYTVLYGFGSVYGNDVWRITDEAGNIGYLSIVSSEVYDQDSPMPSQDKPDIRIEFYNSSTKNPGNKITDAVLPIVSAADDHNQVSGDYGRSWATALDAVARSKITSAITDYVKFSGTQDIQSITANAITYAPDSEQTWLYAVYRSTGGNNYERNPYGEYVHYDDYMLSANDLVLFTIGNPALYRSYFADTLSR
jgi:hypothetical protein